MGERRKAQRPWERSLTAPRLCTSTLQRFLVFPQTGKLKLWLQNLHPLQTQQRPAVAAYFQSQRPLVLVSSCSAGIGTQGHAHPLSKSSTTWPCRFLNVLASQSSCIPEDATKDHRTAHQQDYTWLLPGKGLPGQAPTCGFRVPVTLLRTAQGHRDRVTCVLPGSPDSKSCVKCKLENWPLPGPQSYHSPRISSKPQRENHTQQDSEKVQSLSITRKYYRCSDVSQVR